ncbi:MAG TPA: helix-turn-helix domain-containing protein [Solirubrobacterales bacterium]|nr:helix-turn-helix domain-containing protein [Solirubrobacterales bacterium]
MEQYHCEGCGRELFHFGDDPPPASCEDCIPETGQGSRLVDQVTINLRKLRSEAGIEREELARRAAMSADEIALAEREAAREPGVTRALRLVHSIGVSIDDLADRIYWNPGETARSPEDRRPPSERLSGFFLVLPANVPIFDPPRRASVASREELAEAFGENVRSARERRHLFQKTLAHAAGLSREGLSYIERGIHETTIETMLSIARALQVTPEVLLGGIAWEPRLPPCAPPRRGGAQGHKANSLDGPIKSLWNEGKTGGEIATALGVPRGSVSAIVHRLREHGEDLPYRRRPTRAVHEGARRRRRATQVPENDRVVLEPETAATISLADCREVSDAEIAARLGDNVARHRQAAGLTFRELGEAAELDRSYLNRIEKGELLPRLGLIVKLAACFNVRCERLTSGIFWEQSFGAFRIEADGETDSPLKRLGQNALRERRRVGVSQQALGSRASIDRSDVVDFENGNRNFRVFTAVRLAGALGVNAAELFSGVADWYVRPLPAPEYAPGDRPPTKSERDVVLMRLWREGRPEREIAEALDLRPEAVGPYVRELRDAGQHLPYRRPPRRAIEVAARRRRQTHDAPARVRPPSSFSR